MDSNPLSSMRELAPLPPLPLPPSLAAWVVPLALGVVAYLLTLIIQKRLFYKRPRLQLITEAVAHFEAIREGLQGCEPRESAARMVVELRRLLTVLGGASFSSSSGSELERAVELLNGPQHELGVALVELDRASYSPAWSTSRVEVSLSRIHGALQDLLRTEQQRRMV